MIRSRFPADERGTAATEMALLVPLLVLLLFGGFEAGHFVWTQHKLVEAVRDGARFAGRLNINDLCDGPNAVMSPDTEDATILITRTGQLASTTARPKVPGWTAAEVDVDPQCNPPESVSTGLYSDLGNSCDGPCKGPIVRVSAQNVPYPSLFNSLGIIDTTFTLSARSNAPVIGL